MMNKEEIEGSEGMEEGKENKYVVGWMLNKRLLFQFEKGWRDNGKEIKRRNERKEGRRNCWIGLTMNV